MKSAKPSPNQEKKANGHGGKRPGSGRPTTDAAQYRHAMREVVQTVVTEDEWRQVVMVAVSQAQGGDASARAWLAPWVVGTVPAEVDVTHKGGVTIYMPAIKAAE